MTEELWLPVAGYEGNYEVSNLGRVRSVVRVRSNGPGRTRVHPGCLLTPKLSGNGYPVVALRRGIKDRRFHSVHRLVAIAFVANPDAKPQVNHIDHDRTNAAASNLEWTTQAENLSHMTRAGRRYRAPQHSRGSRASIAEETVRAIRLDATSMSQARVADKHGVSKRAVQRILSGESYPYVL